ncbi:hypothetical protein Sulku_1476 [Sulfuricurvum kujiense DSM 16994]|uniref:DUF304 domain-containing protein n=1 Tax=Sulfuricurvum kujiense (strain ATCC BAA-921 / DSM 16994 / JCM 11577 / YK-1) TaxID=709032 RepID=E4TZC3_SULKY|nr:hypothetical protein [Sulfuricurvum kujiense]ADR34138.1 hypothetical protein Sulku_1476 [Sulfuricurvum kujiense DSM 16994]
MDEFLQNDQVYKTSLYGRLGYFVMILMYLIFVPVFIGLGYEKIITPDYPTEIIVGILFFGMGLGLVRWLICDLFFLFSFRNRVVLENDNIIYYGCFKTLKIKWNDIGYIRLSLRTGPYALLWITVKQRRWPYMLDVSGLKPSYTKLMEEVEKRKDRNSTER